MKTCGVLTLRNDVIVQLFTSPQIRVLPSAMWGPAVDRPPRSIQSLALLLDG